MRILILLILAGLYGVTLQAQYIRGLALDDQGKPLAGSSVALKKNKDSSLVKLGVSDNNGKYSFTNIPAGKYFVNISHIGYLPQNSASFGSGGESITQAPPVLLKKTPAGLQEIIVASSRPAVEVKADRLVLNVEGTVNAVGEDALELLRKSPGVTLDKDNNLSLSGKNGVQVYIDGRPNPLSGTDLSEYLKTIQSGSIESIEIISNPPARYDAAGNAGIINIRLKKNKSFGTNGSVNAGYNIGEHSGYNGGISLNYRDASVNVFGNYTYSHSLVETHSDLYRLQLDTLFDQQSTILVSSNTHNFKAGLDYFINKKNTLGIIVSGSLSGNYINTNSSTPISYAATGKVDRILVANNTSSGRRDNGNLNLNYRYADSSGHEWNVDADYGLYRIRNNQLQPNYYFDPSGTPLNSIIYSMVTPSDINIYSLKSDYEQNFMKGRLGFGFKSSYVTSANNFEQYNVDNSINVTDSLHSNNFDYKENINAAYANYNRTGKGWVIQAGLRAENTNAKGISTGYKQDTGLPSGSYYSGYDSAFNRHYTDLFPSAAITFNKDPARQWTLNYSRRIDRPAYQDLNPFEFRLDEYTFQKGNTQLRPQYTNSTGLTYLYKYKLTTALNFSHVKDIFTVLVDTTDKTKAFITRQNLATQDITSLTISYPLEYRWYSIYANLTTYYSLYKADFGTGRTIDVNVVNATIYARQSAKLGKGWTAEINSYFTSPALWQGTLKSRSIWGADAGLLKPVLKKRGTVKASVSDIFHTLSWSATSHFAGQYVHTSGNYDSRLFKINFTWRFGNTQVKGARARKTGAEEENSRVGSQGGGLNSN